MNRFAVFLTFSLAIHGVLLSSNFGFFGKAPKSEKSKTKIVLRTEAKILLKKGVTAEEHVGVAPQKIEKPTGISKPDISKVEIPPPLKKETLIAVAPQPTPEVLQPPKPTPTPNATPEVTPVQTPATPRVLPTPTPQATPSPKPTPKPTPSPTPQATVTPKVQTPSVPTPKPEPTPRPTPPEVKKPVAPNPLPVPRATPSPRLAKLPTAKETPPSTKPNEKPKDKRVSKPTGASSKNNVKKNESDDSTSRNEIQNGEGDSESCGVSNSVGIKNLPRPYYPSYAREKGHEGTVIVEFEVLENGKLGKIIIVESSGFGELDKAAISAVKKAVFIPATEDGRPVRSTIKKAFTFKLIEKENPVKIII